MIRCVIETIHLDIDNWFRIIKRGFLEIIGMNLLPPQTSWFHSSHSWTREWLCFPLHLQN